MLNEKIALSVDAEGPSIDLLAVDSVALQRLIAEVRQSESYGAFDTTLYNRSYHRHNR